MNTEKWIRTIEAGETKVSIVEDAIQSLIAGMFHKAKINPQALTMEAS